MEIACLFLTGSKRKVWGFIPVRAHTEALSILEKVADRWPSSELAGSALMIKADYYFDTGRFLEAQLAYQDVIDTCKDISRVSSLGTSLYETALLKSAHATYLQYRGPYYDASCLDDTIIRYQRYQLSFPQQARQRGIAEEIRKIQDQQAQKELEIADYYMRTNRIQAARFYWEIIAKRWGQTSWGQQARDHLNDNPMDTRAVQ